MFKRMTLLLTMAASSLAATGDVPWTFRIENHPADVRASAELALSAADSIFDAVESTAGVSADVNLDSIAFLWYVTPGINLDADRRAGTVLIVR